MQIYVQFIPVIAGTSEPAAEPFTLPCPPGLEPDTVRSFLVQLLGDPADVVCTSTPRHGRLEIGWVFDALPAAETGPAAEFLCVPQLRLEDGSMRAMFEVQADQRQDFEKLAAAGALDRHSVVQAPLREYQPARGGADLAELDQLMTQLAAETGGTLHIYPRPGPAVRHVVLRDQRDHEGTRFLAAQIEHDGTLRVIGRDEGPGVCAVFGSGITSYEWIYTVPPDRVGSLVTAAGGQPGQDPLDVLASYSRQHHGLLDELLRNPPVGASFSNWHS